MSYASIRISATSVAARIHPGDMFQSHNSDAWDILRPNPKADALLVEHLAAISALNDFAEAKSKNY